MKSDRVFVRIASSDDRMDRVIYLCRRKQWDSMSEEERTQEVHDRLGELSIIIDIDCDMEDE